METTKNPKTVSQDIRSIEELETHVRQSVDALSKAEDPELNLRNLCEKLREVRQSKLLIPKEKWKSIKEKVWEAALNYVPNKFYIS